MKTNNKTLNILIEIVIALILFISVSIPFFYKIEANSFHGDENLWLRTTKYFKLFFIDRDFHNEQWKEYPVYDQPSVGRYILGFALVAGGYGDRIDELSKMPRWDFSRDSAWNSAHGALPPKDILYAARFSMALLGALSCFLIFWIGKTVFNTRTGILAALLLAYNPLMLLCSRRAMTDAALIFFMTANVALIIYFYSSLLKQKLFRTLVFAVLIGIDIGLAAGTKLNGGLSGIIFAVFCILWVSIKIGGNRFAENHWKSKIGKLRADREIKIIFSSLMISGLVAISVFVGLNPNLYHNPLKESVRMLGFIMGVIKDLQHIYPQHLTSFSQKFSFVIWKTLVGGEYTTLNHLIKIPLDLGLFLLGLILLLFAEGKDIYCHHNPSIKSAILLWTFLTFVGIMAWIPLDWERYYLPIIPCAAMMAGFGLERILDKCWRLAKYAVTHARHRINA